MLNKTIHGDTKISNFLFSKSNYNVSALIDLDTCTSAPILFDLADCVRSCCNPKGEDTLDIEGVYFDLELYENCLLGYLSLPNTILSTSEIYYLPYSIRTVTFELGLRFISDYFRGNIYFETQDDSHNLRRSEVQFKFHQSIISNWKEIIILTNKICKSSQ